MRKRSASLPNPDAYRVDELARRLSVGAGVINKAIRTGELEASKLGDAPRSPVVITREAMQRWLDSKRIRPQAAEAA
jgi:excisionase family DNA binding protein